MLGEPDTACGRRPEVNTGCFRRSGDEIRTSFPFPVPFFSNAAVLRSSLIAKELCLSGAVGDVICSASEVDDRSLDVFISPPPCSSTWMRKRCGGGLKKRAGGRLRKESYTRTLSDRFVHSPCPLNANGGAK